MKGGITQSEFDYANQADLMFDPIDLSDDAAVERVAMAMMQGRAWTAGDRQG
jgi:hypothetical protein